MENILAYVVILFMIYALRMAIEFTLLYSNQKAAVENFMNLSEDKTDNELASKYPVYNAYPYKQYRVDLLNDKDGDHINSEYDLTKEDLMRFIDDSTTFFKAEKIAEPTNTESQVTQLNNNVALQPKKFSAFDTAPTSKPFNSLDAQFKLLNEKNSSQLSNTKSLKNDIWTHDNENPMNGGFIDKDSKLMAYDPSEMTNVMVQ